ncbi:discoidin domain-containing protein [Paenibacillus andongensis]|uniref:discoidin domain-containing protein n=1 Tax=Paenibacillus andongensis TaxID=2975482 RepID=UPI0021BB01F4|nr:discoidin domain-containing protein [Paenibacillus andongensis]
MVFHRSKKWSKVLSILIAFVVAFVPIMFNFPATVQAATTLQTYPAPTGVALNNTFTVQVRANGGAWQNVDAYDVMVQYNSASHASFAYFDTNGPVDVQVTYNGTLTSAAVNPASKGITPAINGNTMTFTIPGPTKLSVEVNGDVAHNLHLFANPIDPNPPSPTDPNVIYVGPGYYNQDYRVPSGKTLYLAGGAVVHGAIYMDSTTNAKLMGRGVIDRPVARAISLDNATGAVVDGIIVKDYGDGNNGGCFMNIGNSSNISINNAKGFGTARWSDGIDVFTSTNVTINDTFIRSGDDSIAVYGPRPNGGHVYNGDLQNVNVTGSILWPDKAHSINIGFHGDPTLPGGGANLDSISFKDIDILTYDPADAGFSLPINIAVANGNMLTNVYFENIRIQDSVVHKIVDISVGTGDMPGGVMGRGINNVYFKNVSYTGTNSTSSPISGAQNVTFENLKVNGTTITSASAGNFSIGGNTSNIRFVAAGGASYTPISVSPRVWPTYTNMALNKTATAGSSAVGSPASGANDSASGTNWTAGSGTVGQWWKMDLGAIRRITGGTQTTWTTDGSFIKYMTEVSVDGVNWTNVVDKSDNTDAHQVQWDHFVTYARYLKISITGLDSGTIPGISDIKVLGDSETWSVSPPAVTAKVNLTSSFNLDGFSYDSNKSNGNFDGRGYTYSADLVNTTPTYNGIPFQLGPMANGMNNVVQSTGQTITVPQGVYSDLWVLGAAGFQTETGTFTIHYTDGTSSTGQISENLWSVSALNAVETFNHRHSSTMDSSVEPSMFADSIPVDLSKTVASVTLPNNTNIKIFAMTLSRSTPVTMADLSSYYNTDGFSYDSNRTNGNFDGAGYSYPADLVNTTPAYGGVPFQLGSMTNGSNNVVKGTGQTLNLTPGAYSSIWFLGAATGGNQTGTFQINYTDGTNSTASITENDWGGQPSNTVVTFGHRHSQTADTTGNWSIFVYSLIPTAGKTVASITLPNNGKMKVFAISMLGSTAGAPLTPQPTTPPTPIAVPAPNLNPATVMVDLSSSFNRDGFSYDTNRSNGNLGGGYSLPAENASSSVTYNGVTFQLGSMDDTSNNVVANLGQTISLPQGAYTDLWFLGTSTDGTTKIPYRLNYTDGTSTSANMTITNWDSSASNTALSFPERHSATADNPGTYRINAYSISVPAGKVVDSLSLPNAGALDIFAITLVGSAGMTGPQVDLTSRFNQDGFSYDTNRANGNYDGAGYSYPAEEANTAPTYNGVSFKLGSLSDGSINVVNATGQTIALPRAAYSQIMLLGSGTNGNQTGTFTINYMDGTTSTASITEANWTNGGTNVVEAFDHRHSQTADQASNCYIYGYSLTPTAGKMVHSITLPNNGNMHIMAITVVN